MPFSKAAYAGRVLNDQHRARIGKCLQRVVTHDVAKGGGIPVATAEDRLLVSGTAIAGCLDAQPARLTALIAKRTIQKLPRRSRRPVLREQWSHRRLHVPQ